MFLEPPKIMKWVPALDQHYFTDKKTLLVSGASYTASTNQLDCAASWPGFLYDRCRFDQVIDLSYPGVGNEYIADSIVYAIDQMRPEQKQDCIVGIMWSGLGWSEEKVTNNGAPMIGTTSYLRKTPHPSKEDFKINTRLSYNKIINTYKYLQEHNISFFSTFYANVLFPPCLPRNDRTCNFADYLDSKQILALQELNWIPNSPKDCLGDFVFFNDGNIADYHPTVEFNLKWTDQVLLPSLADVNLIKRI